MPDNAGSGKPGKRKPSYGFLFYLFLRKIKSRERKFLFIKLTKNVIAVLNSLYFEKFQNHKICFFMAIAKYTQQMLRRF